MRFICQILLDPRLFGKSRTTRMAYLFLTQAGRDEIEEGAFDPDIIFPDQGENAVLVQPGGGCLVETESLTTGPTLYAYDGMPCELSCRLEKGEDFDYVPRDELPRLAKQDRSRFDAYCNTLAGDKIGGTPLAVNNDPWPGNGSWSLLLQLLPKREPTDPFYLNLGATTATGFAFISGDRTEGRFLVD
jgi:hypothetical protein